MMAAGDAEGGCGRDEAPPALSAAAGSQCSMQAGASFVQLDLDEREGDAEESGENGDEPEAEGDLGFGPAE